MPGLILSDRLGSYVHNYTQRGALRPFGSSVIIASYDQEDGYKLNMCEPSGLSYAYHVVATGKGKSVAKAEFEKRNFPTLTCREAIVFATKILKQTHEEFKDK
jgi:20S proteasome subunit alpha 7